MAASPAAGGCDALAGALAAVSIGSTAKPTVASASSSSSASSGTSGTSLESYSHLYGKCSVEGCMKDTDQDYSQHGAILEDVDGKLICYDHAIAAVRTGRNKTWVYWDYMLKALEYEGVEMEHPLFEKHFYSYEDYTAIKCIKCEDALEEEESDAWLKEPQQEPKCESCLEEEDAAAEPHAGAAVGTAAAGGGAAAVKGKRVPGSNTGKKGKPTKVYVITNGFAHKDEAAPVIVQLLKQHPSQVDAFRHVFELCDVSTFDADYGNNKYTMRAMYHHGKYVFPWVAKKDCISVEGKFQPKAGALGHLTGKNVVPMPHVQYLVVINDHETHPTRQFPWGAKYVKPAAGAQ